MDGAPRVFGGSLPWSVPSIPAFDIAVPLLISSTPTNYARYYQSAFSKELASCTCGSLRNRSGLETANCLTAARLYPAGIGHVSLAGLAGCSPDVDRLINYDTRAKAVCLGGIALRTNFLDLLVN